MKFKSLKDLKLVREAIIERQIKPEDKEHLSRLEEQIYTYIEEAGVENFPEISAKNISRSVFELGYRDLSVVDSFFDLETFEDSLDAVLLYLRDYKLRLERCRFSADSILGWYLISDHLYRFTEDREERFGSEISERICEDTLELNSLKSELNHHQTSFTAKCYDLLDCGSKPNNITANLITRFLGYLKNSRIFHGFREQRDYLTDKKNEFENKIRESETSLLNSNKGYFHYLKGGIALITSEAIHRLAPTVKGPFEDIELMKFLRKRVVEVSRSIQNESRRVAHLDYNIHRYTLLLDDRSQEKKSLLEEGVKYARVHTLSNNTQNNVRLNSYLTNLFIVNYVQERKIQLDLLDEISSSMLSALSFIYQNSGDESSDIFMHVMNHDFVKLDEFFSNSVLRDDIKIIKGHCRKIGMSFDKLYANFSSFAYKHSVPKYQGQFVRHLKFARI